MPIDGRDRSLANGEDEGEDVHSGTAVAAGGQTDDRLETNDSKQVKPTGFPNLQPSISVNGDFKGKWGMKSRSKKLLRTAERRDESVCPLSLFLQVSGIGSKPLLEGLKKATKCFRFASFSHPMHDKLKDAVYTEK